MKKILLSLLLVCAVQFFGPAFAAPVTVSDAWFRSLPGNLPAGGYFTAHNGGKKDLAITGASSSACGMLMLHESENKGGMSSMQMVEKVPLPAGGDAKFTAGSFHLMCEQPKMKIGGKVAVSLALSDGSAVDVSFDVKDAKGQ